LNRCRQDRVAATSDFCQRVAEVVGCRGGLASAFAVREPRLGDDAVCKEVLRSA